MSASDIIARAKRDAEDAQRVASDPRPWASHIRLLDAALAAVPAWHPAETAPTDEMVLIWHRVEGAQAVGFASRCPTTGWWDEGGLRVSPSHWMPLPKGPEVTPPVTR